MKDITGKPETLREARAEAFLEIGADGMERIRQGTVEKGDVLEASRLTAVQGVKRTPEVLPWCHPLPIGAVDAEVAVEEDGLRVSVAVRSVAPTGMEMEALTGATLGALNAYDMLKPHTDHLELRTTRLMEKRGGKSDFPHRVTPSATAAILVLSDSVAAGRKEDRAGAAVRERLETIEGLTVEVQEVLPDEPEELRGRASTLVEDGVELLVTVGGTGLWQRDRTVEGIGPLIDRPVPGIMEAARAHGQRRTPYAMLSRGVAGLARQTLILTLPGSTRGALESLDALLPGLPHALRIVRRPGHTDERDG